MLINSVTNELFDGDEGIDFIPVHFTRRLIEWVTKDNGGGFVAEHLVSPALLGSTKRDDNGRDILPNGNQLVDTRNHYGLCRLADGRLEPVLITMSSTQGKKSKRWMSLMAGLKIGTFQAPMFSHAYNLTTVPEKNEHGSWFGWKIGSPIPLTSEDEYRAAKSFREQIASGEVKVQHEEVADTTAPAEDIPF